MLDMRLAVSYFHTACLKLNLGTRCMIIRSRDNRHLSPADTSMSYQYYRRNTPGWGTSQVCPPLSPPQTTLFIVCSPGLVHHLLSAISPLNRVRGVTYFVYQTSSSGSGNGLDYYRAHLLARGAQYDP
jgi:hypothetical protein